MSHVLVRRVVPGLLLALCLFGGARPQAHAQVGIGVGIGLPSAQIGINIPVYPQLVGIPGYPVYYAPSLDANLFFYDGQYWLFTDDEWYASTWYDGPWYLVAPEFVPAFILRIPIRYYRRPPGFFRYWNRNQPPRWGEHWGPRWRSQRPRWDQWNRRAVPPRAPLPRYQRNYPRSRYPNVRQQRILQDRYYYSRRPDVRRRPPAPQRERQPQQRYQRQPQQRYQRQPQQRSQRQPQQRSQRQPQQRSQRQPQQRSQRQPQQRSQRQPQQRSQRQPQHTRDRERDRRPGGAPPG